MAELPVETDPKDDQVRAGLEGYRTVLINYALDETFFSEKLGILLGAQQEGSVDSSASLLPLRLERVADDGWPVMVRTLGGLVIGCMGGERPWSLAATPPRWKGDRFRDIGLVAHFANVRAIDHTQGVRDAGHEGNGAQRQTGPNVWTPDEKSFVVDLKREPAGPEHFGHRLADSLRDMRQIILVGRPAIHDAIDGMKLSPEQQTALQEAASMAIEQMVIAHRADS